MKTKSFLITLLLSLPAFAEVSPPSLAEDSTTVNQASRADWLDVDKFGLFIHWGLYSQIAKGEWYMHAKKMPIAEYSGLSETCNPTKFKAEEWVQIAKEAGMKYIVITSKHHDGFALFDSEASDYNLVDATPFKRDMIAELKEACDAAGIKLGLYYSHAQDWYRKGGSPLYDWTQPTTMQDMQAYLDEVALPQVREILIQYDPAIIWYDTPRRMNEKMARPFSEVVRELSPDTLINSRLIRDGNQMEGLSSQDLKALRDMGVDYLSYADREIPDNSPWQHWETCMTLNGAWGYNAHDHKWKSPSHVIQQLLEVVSKNGAFLLNVGPTPEGEFPPASVEVLKQVGQWLNINGEAVYGAEPVTFNLAGTPTQEYLQNKAAMEKRFANIDRPMPHVPVERDFPWIATRNKGVTYLTIFDWQEGELKIEGVDQAYCSAVLMGASPVEIPLQQTEHHLTISLPPNPNQNLPTVIKLQP